MASTTGDGGADHHRLTLAVIEAARRWKQANDAREQDWEQLVAEDRSEEWSESRAGRHARALADAEKALAAAVAALGKGA